MKERVSEILRKLGDRSHPSDCLVFYRPSFARGGGKANFGEFDAILASPTSVYLMESKWDGLSPNRKDEIELRKEQVLRHEIFAWYYRNWDSGYHSWREFKTEKEAVFPFKDRGIAPENSILARNLEFVLSKLHDHGYGGKRIRNVLLYFYDERISKKIRRVVTAEDGEEIDFEVVNIEYGRYTSGGFISLK
ncbi:MAG: hypothetical protein DRJ43_01090 [Thermoprotei archaeon]|nr:MAG: hypothetical protein DRJ43_01090 [Thermoprotei archaeon]